MPYNIQRSDNMVKRIAVDDVTFVTLKNLANKNGRTIVGQLRWLLDRQEPIFRAADPYTFAPSGNDGDDMSESSEFQQLYDRLQYLDEDSPEYEETLLKLSKLQKKS